MHNHATLHHTVLAVIAHRVTRKRRTQYFAYVRSVRTSGNAFILQVIVHMQYGGPAPLSEHRQLLQPHPVRRCAAPGDENAAPEHCKYNEGALADYDSCCGVREYS